MSEEPEVSPLRLKRPGVGGPTPPAENPPVAPAPAPEPPLAPLPLGGIPPGPATAPGLGAHEPGSAERARRRPSLAPEAGAFPASSPSSHPHPAPHPEHPAASPTFAHPTETPGASGAPVFKLKIGTKPPPPPVPPPAGDGHVVDPLKALEETPSGAPLLPLPGMGPASASGVPPPPLMPLPVLPPATANAAEPAGARGPIHLRAEAPAEALDPSKLPPPPLPARAAKAAVNRGHAKRDALVFGLIFLLVVGAGSGAYFYFSGPPPQTSAPVTAKAVADARQKEQARVDSVVEGKEPPANRAIGNVTPGELQSRLQEKNTALPPAPVPPAPVPPVASQGTAIVAAGPDAAPAPPTEPATPQANPRFVRYAEGIRVSGVYQGSPARALIDGRLIRQGELVEPALGIKFADIDVEAKKIILEDASGARVKVKYL